MPPAPTGFCPQLPPDFLAMMSRGVSVIVGTRDQAHQPHLMRAVGSQVGADGRQITVYLSRRQSTQVLADLAANGQIAVVFSEPSTHRTVQVKSSRAQARQWQDGDAEVLARYLCAMEQELAQVGIDPTLTRTLLTHQCEDVVAISFCPEEAFDQTPGTHAGAPLGTTAP